MFLNLTEYINEFSKKKKEPSNEEVLNLATILLCLLNLTNIDFNFIKALNEKQLFPILTDIILVILI